MTPQPESYKAINSRIIRIKLIDGTQINGQVNINRNKDHNRLSDLVCNENDEFLIVFKATTFHKEVDEPVKYETLFVNKSHILWAAPDEQQL